LSSARSSRESRRASTSGGVEILPIIEASSLRKSGSHKHKHRHSHSSSSSSSKSTSSRRYSNAEVESVDQSSSGKKPPKIAEKVLCEDSRGNVYKIEYLDKAGNLIKTERT